MMAEQYEYDGYVIRRRELAAGEEWQVVEARKILSRHETERRARKWVRETTAKSQN